MVQNRSMYKFGKIWVLWIEYYLPQTFTTEFMMFRPIQYPFTLHCWRGDSIDDPKPYFLPLYSNLFFIVPHFPLTLSPWRGAGVSNTDCRGQKHVTVCRGQKKVTCRVLIFEVKYKLHRSDVSNTESMEVRSI